MARAKRVPRTDTDASHLRRLPQVPTLERVAIGDGEIGRVVAREGSEKAGLVSIGRAEDGED